MDNNRLSGRRGMVALVVSLVALGVVAQAVPASAATPPDGLTFNVMTSRVSLSEGAVTADNDNVTFGPLPDIAEDAVGSFHGVKAMPNRGYLYSNVRYRISMNGHPTDYYVLPTYSWRSNSAMCFVRKGYDPVQKAPFVCSITRLADWTFDVRVGLNRYVESSGAIEVVDFLGLSDGQFESDAPYRTSGAPALVDPRPATAPTVPSSTSFSAVLREGDTSAFENQARTEFSYQVVDGDEPTGVWVAGVSTNHRGSIYNGDGRCAFYDHNPLEAHQVLDDSVPIEDSKVPYVCHANGDYYPDRGSYRAHFTVGRRG
jgi:hypothetical protein